MNMGLFFLSRHQDVKDVVKPYDWTYTTAYRGTLNDKAIFHEAEEPSIDVARLQKQEPILFYDENILYEDELADNGTTILSVRLVSWMAFVVSKDQWLIYMNSGSCRHVSWYFNDSFYVLTMSSFV